MYKSFTRTIGLAALAALFLPAHTMAVERALETQRSIDENPIRRGEESAPNRRRSLDSRRQKRAALEQAKKPSLEEQKRKEQTKVVTLVFPPSCGSRNAPEFRERLLKLKNPNDAFNVEVWGNQRVYYVNDSIEYYIRSNRTAYVSLFWIGPEGSVFIPFGNLRVEANRDHRINPRNIIVEPVGLERWRVIATLEPHFFPCRGGSSGFNTAHHQLQDEGLWAIGRWDVLSKVVRKKRRRRRTKRRNRQP